MGRFYHGDIEGKLGFGTQPSSTFEQFGGYEIEPSYISYGFEGFKSEDNDTGFDTEHLVSIIEKFNANLNKHKKKFKYCKPESLTDIEKEFLNTPNLEQPSEEAPEYVTEWSEKLYDSVISPYISYINNTLGFTNATEDVRLAEDAFLGLKIYYTILKYGECFVDVDI